MTAVSGLGVSSLAEVASQFPVLRNRPFDGRPVAYLDSAATSQTPDAVIDAMTSYYTEHRASIHRGRVSARRRGDRPVRGRARRGSPPGSGRPSRRRSSRPTPPRRSTWSRTRWGRQNVQRGDLVVLTEMEHHSNIVPWQLLCQDREAELAYVPVSSDGFLDLDALDSLLARGPRLVGVVHVSNVLGTVNPVADDRAAGARSRGGRAGRRRRRRCRRCRSGCPTWTSTSTRGPATRRTGRPGSGCCTAGARCSRRCRRSSVAAT